MLQQFTFVRVECTRAKWLVGKRPQITAAQVCLLKLVSVDLWPNSNDVKFHVSNQTMEHIPVEVNHSGQMLGEE